MKLLPLLLLITSWTSCFFVHAGSLELSDGQNAYDLKQFGLFFHDYDKQITSLSQLQDLPQLLKPYSIQKPHIKPYWKWSKIELINNTDITNWYVSFGFARLPILEMYWLDESQNIILLNEQSSFSKRPLHYPQMYVPINILPNERKTLFIKYQTFANAPAKIQIHPPEHFNNTVQLSLLNNAVIAGVVIAILLIVLVNLYFNRNLTNVYYAIWSFMFLLIVIDMAGFTYQYLWPELGEFATTFSIMLMVLVPIFHLLFVRSFLQLKHHHPQLDNIYLGCLTIYIVLVPLALYLQSVFYNLLASSLMIVIFIYTCYWCWQQRAPGIKIFSASLLNHVLFVNVLTILGASFGNIFAAFDISTYIKIGYLIEVCLFTVAMAVQHKSVQRQLVYHLQNQVDALNQSVLNEQRNSQQKSEQVKKQEQRLFTDLSHELRTPLTVMKIQVESLQHNIVENVHESYSKLHDKIDELNDFINILMLVSDSRDLHFGLNIRSTAIGPFINEVNHSCLQKLNLQKQRLTLNCQLSGIETINIDKNAIAKVVEEVVINAAKFGGANVEVILSFIDKDEHLIVRIEDSGNPLTYEAHQLLFEPLFRQEPSRSSLLGGKGMGLAVCKKIIQAHQGEITSHNSLLGGVCIEFTLPKSFAYEPV
ncbi:Adaptive-response sensory-kinase SasA [Pseudoalteromonas sp. CIP111854]|uniref:histidine kinase n=1 Tax=Pseudoalteromonas holothuriae TaxID=2963714 RepID=A0A9W4R423_9GAMM|nr:sensor histidine kinase [Pseudoalteromonas sp. CIP111854]CAH9065173.1 Adaptive-response sensory-kinase SasA [Pseudoalteromonas sp. CIP111854]